jgi:hypothetical protein
MLAALSVMILTAAFSRPVLGWEMPSGTWQAEGGSLTLSIAPEHRLVLGFKSAEGRTVTVAASYGITITKFADFSTLVKVEDLSGQGPAEGPARKLAWTRQLGFDWVPGKEQEVAFDFNCLGGHPTVRLTIYEKHDGTGHNPSVLLLDQAKTCQEPPPMDGSLINAPANLPEKK